MIQNSGLAGWNIIFIFIEVVGWHSNNNDDSSILSDNNIYNEYFLLSRGILLFGIMGKKSFFEFLLIFLTYFLWVNVSIFNNWFSRIKYDVQQWIFLVLNMRHNFCIIEFEKDEFFHFKIIFQKEGRGTGGAGAGTK